MRLLHRTARLLTYANIVATLALFLALADGTAWALTIRSSDIADGTIRARDIAPGQFTRRELV